MIELIGRLGVDIEAFSIGGGLSTPYRSTDKPVDLQRYAQTWAVARKEIEAMLGHPVRMEIEPGASWWRSRATWWPKCAP
jgi:diaminopimelate decarboxylase